LAIKYLYYRHEGLIKRRIDLISLMLYTFFWLLARKLYFVIKASPRFVTVIPAWALRKLNVKILGFDHEFVGLGDAYHTQLGLQEEGKILATDLRHGNAEVLISWGGYAEQ